MKNILSIVIGFLGFFVLPVIWIGIRMNEGNVTPQSIVIFIIWGITYFIIKTIRSNDKPENNSKSEK